jgi:hypothetical protein
VNGQQVNLPATDSSTALDETEFAQLILAMTSSQANGSGSTVFSGTQVQIWNA